MTMRVTCRPPTTLTSLLLLLLKKLPLELVNQVDPLQHLLLLLYVGYAGALHTQRMRGHRLQMLYRRGHQLGPTRQRPRYRRTGVN